MFYARSFGMMLLERGFFHSEFKMESSLPSDWTNYANVKRKTSGTKIAHTLPEMHSFMHSDFA